ncbi:MAG: isopentenyl phosphate kinase family protein [Anaerolineales bacterium]|nr:isopentenyl phosphate kinase family protein [Anaerolineales bacterium]
MSLVFLKLGGSLITDKDIPSTPRVEVIRRIADEIKSAVTENPNLQLILGHGSGSFGHQAAKKYQTINGVHIKKDWGGFSEVWYQASTLNRLVIETLHRTGLPVVNFPAVNSVLVSEQKILKWETKPIQAAYQAGLIPVVYGDVVFDDALGGTILSTEKIFSYLVKQLKPNRILLAGLEEGIWEDFPSRKILVSLITPENIKTLRDGIKGSEAADVTGGMSAKVADMLALVRDNPSLSVSIFSGLPENNIFKALTGNMIGTSIQSD